MVRFHSAVALLQVPSAAALSRAFFTSNTIWNTLLKKAVWDSKSEEAGFVHQLLFVCSGIRTGFFLESDRGKKRFFVFWEKKLEKKDVYEIKYRWCEWWFINKYTRPSKKGVFAQKMKDFYSLVEKVLQKLSMLSFFFTLLQLLTPVVSPCLPLLFAFIHRMHSCFTVWKWA